MNCNMPWPRRQLVVRTAAVSLCLLALCACSSQPPLVKTELVRLLPPPGLVPRCPEPEFNGTTWGEAVAFIPTLQGALRRCQQQITTLNHWIEQEENQP